LIKKKRMSCDSKKKGGSRWEFQSIEHHHQEEINDGPIRN